MPARALRREVRACGCVAILDREVKLVAVSVGGVRRISPTQACDVLCQELLSTRFRPDTRLDRGGHDVGSHGGSDGGHGGEAERSRSGAPDGRPEGGREVRWSARRKEEVVLRLLRGEGLDALARETGQAAGTISAWREEFLAAGREGLKSRPAPVEDRRLADAQRKIGELAMDNDILRGLLEEMGRRPRSPRR